MSFLFQNRSIQCDEFLCNAFDGHFFYEAVLADGVNHGLPYFRVCQGVQRLGQGDNIQRRLYDHAMTIRCELVAGTVEPGGDHRFLCGQGLQDETAGRIIKRGQHSDVAGGQGMLDLRCGPQEQDLLVEWIRSLPKPVAILACNDPRGQRVLEACGRAGVMVPDEVAVMGVDNDEPLCEVATPPLTSIQPDHRQVGYQAAALLHRMMRGEEAMSGQRILAQATGITPRQSTDLLMVRNPGVRKALCFIRENANRPIRVTDVVRAAGVSHRALNDQFNAELNCSIVEQLTRARISCICRLLADTDMQVQEIAEAVGYKDECHFSRYVKRATGLTPQAYRRKILLP